METHTIDKPDAAQSAPPLRLTMTRQQSMRAIRAAIKIGEAIAGQRIRERWELDQARAEKLEWVQRTTDVLGRLFNSNRVADWCNEWVGRILPEYADLGAFIEQFEQEMEHRLTRLRKVLRKVEDVPDVSQTIIHGIRTSGPETPETPEADSPVTASSAAPAVATAAGDPAEASTTEAPDVTLTEPADTETNMQATLIPSSELAARIQAPLPASAPAAPSTCLLLCREDNPAVREAITAFTSQLELTVKPLVGAAPEELDHASGGFAILMAGAQGLDLFELGFSVGRLGNKRVCVIVPPDSAAGDYRGLPAIQFDAGEAWQFQLARQLRRGGMNIDLNRLA